jgi:hypothetical protein
MTSPYGPDRSASPRRSAVVAQRGLSTGGELLAALCRAEALASGLDDDQFADLVHARGDLIARHRGNESAERRRRVLAHEDLAKRLRNVLGLADAKTWNGYVPPRTDGTGRLNTSRIRAQLVAICREAYERDTTDRSASA